MDMIQHKKRAYVGEVVDQNLSSVTCAKSKNHSDPWINHQVFCADATMKFFAAILHFTWLAPFFQGTRNSEVRALLCSKGRQGTMKDSILILHLQNVKPFILLLASSDKLSTKNMQVSVPPRGQYFGFCRRDLVTQVFQCRGPRHLHGRQMLDIWGRGRQKNMEDRQVVQQHLLQGI